MLPPAVMQTTQKRLLNLVAPGSPVPDRHPRRLHSARKNGFENGSRPPAVGKRCRCIGELIGPLISSASKQMNLSVAQDHGASAQSAWPGTSGVIPCAKNSDTNHYFQGIRPIGSPQPITSSAELKQHAHENLAPLYLERYHWDSDEAALSGSTPARRRMNLKSSVYGWGTTNSRTGLRKVSPSFML